ncbi:MAG: dihydrodipicolinate reductase C-terminal domain-containing protein [Candidatus Korobacteraceae bacterium]
MNLVLLGAGKTGSVVAGVAGERGHQMKIVEIDENPDGVALTRASLAGVDAVIDFTSPHAVLKNIEACARAGTNMVVGTTGWYEHIPEVRTWVEQAGTGLIFASNFSVGVNVFFKAIAAAAAALKHGYRGDILERHHIHKKDAPSGTAATMRQIVEQVSGKRLEIRSEREGEVFGFHQLTLTSAADSIVLMHDATSRRGFAEGAVLAAEWIHGKKGFYEFKDIFDQL